MTDEIDYKNNPLHGLSLKPLLEQLVDHYGFEILFAYLNINCFKTNPSVESSVKFLKKTDWAREKVEGFYLYQFKNLPKATGKQFALPPRDRIIPSDQSPGEPAELSVEDAERLNAKRAQKAAEFDQGKRSGGYKNKYGAGSSKSGGRSGNSGHRSEIPHKNSHSSDSTSSESSNSASSDPWAKWKK